MIDFLNHWGPIWSNYFAFTVIQNTLFVGLILLVLHMVRNARAHVKYGIALVGMLKLLVPPFLQLTGLGLPFTAPAVTSVPVGSETIVPLTLSHAPGGAGTAVPAGTALNTAGGLLLIWMAVVGGYLILSLISTLRLRVRLGSAVPVNDWPGVVGASGRAIGIYRSDRISMPLTLGVFPSKIYVPPCWDEWTAYCRRTVISHEIAHIERRDGLVQLLEILIRSLYFFHPLVWILTAKLGTYREMACDDAAVSTGSGSPAAYSRYLVEIAERLLVHPVGCQSASALVRQRHELMDRVRYQMKEGEMRFISKRTKRIILVSLLVLVVPLSWYCGRAETETGEMADSQSAEARADAAVAGKPHSFEYVELIIGEGRDIRVDGEPVVWKDLAAELDAKAADGRDKTVVAIRCGQGVKMGALSDLQNILIAVGLTKVSYQDAEGNALALILPGEKEKKLIKHLDSGDLTTLTVEPTGEVSLDGQRMQISQVKDIVKKRLTLNPHMVVSILTLADTEYADFHAVLDQVKAAGAKRISVS